MDTRDLHDKGMQTSESVLPAEMDVYIGDLVAEGTGEICLRRAAAE